MQKEPRKLHPNNLREMRNNAQTAAETEEGLILNLLIGAALITRFWLELSSRLPDTASRLDLVIPETRALMSSASSVMGILTTSMLDQQRTLTFTLSGSLKTIPPEAGVGGLDVEVGSHIYIRDEAE